MKYFIKENGYVWLVEEHDEAGKFITKYNMGKDPDELDKSKKTKKESSE